MCSITTARWCSASSASARNGVLISNGQGMALAYSLFNLQERGGCASARARRSTRA